MLYVLSVRISPLIIYTHSFKANTLLNWLKNGNEHNVNNRVLVCTNYIISSSDIVGVKHDFCPLSYFRFVT